MFLNEYVILGAGSILWCAPFPFTGRKRKSPSQLDLRARWGIALQCLAYSILWQSSFWARSPNWRLVTGSILFFALASLLSWTGARALGRHLRVDAAVDANQELVRSGPYRFIRHPIYTSMLCVLLATGLLISPTYLLLLSVLTFLIGTEIRMRLEDKLLAMHFGELFSEYCSNVPRLIPFVRVRRAILKPPERWKSAP